MSASPPTWPGVLKADTILVIGSEEGDGKELIRAITKKGGQVGVEVGEVLKFKNGKVSDTFLKDALKELLGGGGDKSPGAGRGGRGGQGKGGQGRPPAGGDKGKGKGDKGKSEGLEIPFDAILIIGDAASGAKIVNQIARMNIDVPIFGTDSFATDEFVQAAKASKTVDLLITSNFSDRIITAAAYKFIQRFKVAAGTDEAPVQALFTYDAAMLVGEAVRAGASDAAAIQASLAGRSSADTSLSGLTGLLHFGKNGATNRQPLFLMIYKGALKPAYTQLREVTDKRILREVKSGATEDSPRLKDHRVVLAGDTPYYKTAVVYTGIDFYRVNQVDVAGQKFDLEFFSWYHFQGDVDTENISFLNAVNEETSTNEVLRQDVGANLNYVCYKVKGTYLTPYNLRNFPFDFQALPLKMAHKTRDSNEIILVVDQDGLSDAPIRDIYPEEWLHRGRADFSASFIPDTTFGDPMYMGLGNRSAFSVYESNLIVRRIIFPYLITLFLPLGIMIVISLFVFLINRDQFDARLTLTMTALLSILVFHLAQGESLPSVGYLMKADQYFIATYILMFSLIFEVIAVNALHDKVAENKLLWLERIFAVVFVVVSFAVYIALTVTAFTG